jgi:hypothetical protein
MSIVKLQGFPVPAAGQNFSAETVSAVTNLLNLGEVSVSDVSSHFKVDPSIVIMHLTGRNPDGYTNETLTQADGDAMNKLVKAGVASIQDVANYYSAPVSVVEETFKTGYNYTPAQISNARNGVSINTVSDTVDAITPTQDANPNTGLRGSEESLNTGVAAAINALNASNVQNSALLRKQYEEGLATATNQNTLAQGDITSSTAAGIAALNASEVAAAANLNTQTDAGLLDAQNAATKARGDINSGVAKGLMGALTGNILAKDAINTSTQRGLLAAETQAGVARGDINTNADLGLNALNSGLDQARSDISTSFDRAEGMYDPYREAGTNALGVQQALSGALGQDAFNAAYNESPQMAFLREQGMRANLAGAGATGGLGGGNVQKELQRFGQGLASQGLQQQISNLSTLSGQGLNATGSAAGTATTGGTNLANLEAARADAGMQSYSNRGTNLANIASGLGTQQLNTNVNQGTNLANIESEFGAQQLNAYTNQGANLSNIASNLGNQQLNAKTNLGTNLANMNITGGNNEMNALTNAGTNRANLASALGGQALGVSTGLGNTLFQNNASSANMVANLNNNLGINLATGRTNAGNYIADSENQTATNLANSYSNQVTNENNVINGQRETLVQLVDSGYINEAQAQTMFGEYISNLEMSRGAAASGVPNVPIVNANYANTIGNAAEAAATGYYLGGGAGSAGTAAGSAGTAGNEGQTFSPVQAPSFRDVFPFNG